MALQIDEIRRLAERVAGSHHLEVVDLEFGGGGKSRALRVFIEKDAAEREKLKARLQAAESEYVAGMSQLAEMPELAGMSSVGRIAPMPPLPELPKGVPVELLSGVTHEDCAAFATDFGTLLDVEDVVPGSEYTLEVSSPGLERTLKRPEEFERFSGSLVKVKTFAPVKGGRIWTGRLTGFVDGVLKIDLAAVKQKGKAKKAAVTEVIDVELKNVEKANLVVEI